jgi:hypothetical protein
VCVWDVLFNLCVGCTVTVLFNRTVKVEVRDHLAQALDCKQGAVVERDMLKSSGWSPTVVIIPP